MREVVDLMALSVLVAVLVAPIAGWAFELAEDDEEGE